MKSILRFSQQASQQDSSSDTSSERQNQSSNTNEDTSTQSGLSMLQESNQALSVAEQRTMMVAQVALNNLFENKHFSICKLNEVMELLKKGRTNSRIYKQLHALHCVDYADMPDELKNQIPYMINELLTNKPPTQAATNVALAGIFD